MTNNVIPFIRKEDREVTLAVQQTQVVKTNDINEVMEKVILAGDLAEMAPKDRVIYYLKTCESMGMNPMTKPFDLITLNGKMVLYLNRSGTDQLRKVGNVDVKIVDKGFDKDTGCYVVTARATLPSGRNDEDMGIVYCLGLKGDALANAQLKAMTKAKRRVTLGIMGLGWVDESEVSSIKDAKTHKMDLDTGAIIDVSTPNPNPKPPETKPQIGGDDNSVFCDVEGCGEKMALSKAGLSYYCPNWNKGGNHLRFSVKDLSKYQNKRLKDSGNF